MVVNVPRDCHDEPDVQINEIRKVNNDFCIDGFVETNYFVFYSNYNYIQQVEDVISDFPIVKRENQPKLLTDQLKDKIFNHTTKVKYYHFSHGFYLKKVSQTEFITGFII